MNKTTQRTQAHIDSEQRVIKLQMAISDAAMSINGLKDSEYFKALSEMLNRAAERNRMESLK